MSAQTEQRRAGAWWSLALDLFMVALAVCNLTWLIFDSIWAVSELRDLLGWVIPSSWLAAYAPVHDYFFRIDLIFVSIFISEFVLRWAHCLYTRQYPYWFAYPILHWYDILGCIPVAGFRWLRILRIFAILHRLQRMGLIDYRGWRIYRLASRLYDIVMEEISDRVVLNVLDGVQQEIHASHEVEKRLIEQVFQPRQQLITDALRARIVSLGHQGYTQSREDLHGFVTRTVSKAVHENREIQTIDRIPLVGGVVSQRLDHAITDIVCRVIDEFAHELDGPEFARVFNDIGNSVFSSFAAAVQEPGTRDQFSQAVDDMLEVIKNQVRRRRWLDAPLD